jgi:RNA polymerase sigma-70 factor (ECF subfamily)
MEAPTRILVENAARGDRQAVEVLLQRYLPGLHAFVRLRAGQLVGAKESSSDLVQSVCREVLEHIETFRYPSEGAFKHWLYTTALRKILHKHEYYRAEKRDVLREVQQSSGSNSSGDAAALNAYQTFSSPSGQAIVREELERIELAFEKLPDEYREVIVLAKVVGLSRSEIGERIGKSEGAVRILLHRALARLAQVLESPEEKA